MGSLPQATDGVGGALTVPRWRVRERSKDMSTRQDPGLDPLKGKLTGGPAPMEDFFQANIMF